MRIHCFSRAALELGKTLLMPQVLKVYLDVNKRVDLIF